MQQELSPKREASRQICVILLPGKPVTHFKVVKAFHVRFINQILNLIKYS